jgi:hypothetical protein
LASFNAEVPRAISDSETRHAGAHFRHCADDFMTGNNGPPGTIELAIDHMKIGAAHAARVDIDQYLPDPGRRVRHVLCTQKR